MACSSGDRPSLNLGQIFYLSVAFLLQTFSSSIGKDTYTNMTSSFNQPCVHKIKDLAISIG